MHRRAWSEVLDHLGLVAGMFDELGIGDGLARALQHTPETRLVTVGSAVKAMVLNGLGLVNQPRYLVPMFLQNKPTQRRIAPGVDAQQLHDETLGRTLDRLYDDGVTALYRRIAATAAPRLGLALTVAHLESTSFPVNGRDNSAVEPDAAVMHITRGDSRDQRPDLNQVMHDLIVEHQAGIPLLRKPRRGTSRDVQDFGQVVTAHITPLQTTDGTTALVADSALSRAEHLQKLGEPGITWITRVPAPVTEAQEALAHAPPDTMKPRGEHSRDHGLASTYGGVAPRWILCDAAQRRPQAQRSVDTHWLKQSEADTKAFQKLCRTALACAAEAQQALASVAHRLPAASLPKGPISPRPRSRMRGRPGQDTAPVQVVYPIPGALTSSLAAHEALITPQRCFILATNELDAHRVPPKALLAGYQDQPRVERGVRFLNDPRLLAAAISRQKPERIMALLMVMTVSLLVYAALAYRIRKALKDHEATFPNQTGQPV